MKKILNTSDILQFPANMPVSVRAEYLSGMLNEDQIGDTLYHERVPIHPMVAMFIALPINKSDKTDPVREIRIQSPERVIQVQSSSFHDLPDNTIKKKVPLGIPQGLHARRLLLYIFSQVHLHNNVMVFPPNLSKKQELELLGYCFKKSQQGNHPVKVEYFRLQKTIFRFLHPKDNKEAGYDIEKYSDNLFSFWKNENGVYEENYMYVNPNFMFRVGFPVDFSHVIGTKKRSRFWNVYMLLVSVLPIIQKGRVLRLSWELVHQIFCYRPPNLAHFKNMFKQEAEEVTELYIKAKGKVITNDKTYLKLKYAPPPI